jgi:hypothetical protein
MSSKTLSLFLVFTLTTGSSMGQEVYVATGAGYVLHGHGSYCDYDTLRPMSDTIFTDLAQTPGGRLFGISDGGWGSYLTLYEIDTLTGEAVTVARLGTHRRPPCP